MPGSTELCLLCRFVSVPRAVLALLERLSPQKYLDRLQSSGANQGQKRLDFSRLSNATNVL